jgi:hypothetical protein
VELRLLGWVNTDERVQTDTGADYLEFNTNDANLSSGESFQSLQDGDEISLNFSLEFLENEFESTPDKIEVYPTKIFFTDEEAKDWILTE